jgi:hypothetical protein
MADTPEIPADWTEPERWVWQRIAAGEPADLNARDRERTAGFENLDPNKAEGWTEQRRLRVRFLQTILTQKAYAEATPYGGTRISGALVDDAPLNLEHARLQRLFWLEQSRILVDVKGRNLRIDGAFSLEASFVAGSIGLRQTDIRENLHLNLGKFHGEVNLMSASISADLVMDFSTIEKSVNANGATVNGSVFLRGGAIFKGEVNLIWASIGSTLEMDGSTFEEKVTLNGATVNGSAFLSGGATFKGDVDLGSASIGSALVMDGSTFEKRVSLNGATVNGAAFLRGGATFKGEVNLVNASIGSSLEMTGSTFEKRVSLSRATVNGSAFLRGGATFKNEVDLVGTSIGSDLDFSGAYISGEVDLSGCKVTGELRLGSSGHPAALWEDVAALVLRNAQVGALQDWWRDESDNSWPKALQLEGFTYDRLGGLSGEGKEADMMARSVASYLQWLDRDPSASPQRYEQLARFFRQAGDPRKANDILYEARERRRRMTLVKLDDHGQAKDRDWFEGLGLWLLRLTVGYGLGRRYFRVLWWVGGLSLLGMVLLITFGEHSLPSWPALFFASLDQLLPIVTLDKAHDALIFGNASAKSPIEPQRDGVRFFFYSYKVIGWVLGSFIVAGLAGLTQRN